METAPELEVVLAAVRTLYHDQDPRRKEEASSWLDCLQKSVHAWETADQLLQRQQDVESCYFAAQTMRQKIQNSFSELPPSAHASLRGSLLQHLQGLASSQAKAKGATSSVIVTQLCLAMADLILLMPEWNSALSELMGSLSSSPGTVLPLLEVLLLLPEEVDSRHLRLGLNRRTQVKEMLSAASPHITQFIQSVLAGASREGEGESCLSTQVQAIKCYSSWLSLGCIPLSSLGSSPVLGLCVSLLSVPGTPQPLHEAATDCLLQFLHSIEREAEREEAGTAPSPALSLANQVIETLGSLEDSYQHAVADEDLEKCLNYCRLFTELGECLLVRLVSCPSSLPCWPRIFSLVLSCCAHPDYELPDVTFNLWYRLSEELYTKNDDSLVAMFKPQVERLVSLLVKHCMMEPDTQGVLQEGEDFTEFRARVQELIKDCVFIVGSSSVFRGMAAELGAATSWEHTEAALFVMAAVGRNLVPSEGSVVPAVVGQVLQLPPDTHVAVRLQALRLVGELGEWIREHPDTLQAVLNYLLGGLQDPRLASVAATALQGVCCECRKQMGEHFGGLLQILEQVDKFSIKHEAANGLIKGIVLVIGTMSEAGAVSNAVGRVCLLQVQPLEALLAKGAGAGKGVSKHSTQDPVLYLDRLSAVFRHVQPNNGCKQQEGEQHPATQVIEQLWPVLARCLDVYQEDVRITERTCRAIRFAIRCIGVQSSSLLEPLVTKLVHLYEARQHSCYLYLGSILVDEYASSPGCTPGLLSMLGAFIAPTYSLLAKPGGLREHPDTVDDFFRLNARFLTRAPLPYLGTEFLKSILECALLSSALDHRDANASVMKFFYDLVHAGQSRREATDYSVRRERVAALLQEYGGKLVRSLLVAAVTTLPSYTHTDLGDVLHEVARADRDTFSKWLRESLEEVQQGQGLSCKVTNTQLLEFHKEVTEAEAAANVSQSIREFVRLWR